jgi:hypothetical protein
MLPSHLEQAHEAVFLVFSVVHALEVEIETFRATFRSHQANYTGRVSAYQGWPQSELATLILLELLGSSNVDLKCKQSSYISTLSCIYCSDQETTGK